MLIADDLGLDWAPCRGNDLALPNLQALCDSGLSFTHVWANPSCTPSRASLLTGRYALRHRAGSSTNPQGVEVRRLRQSEIIIPEALDLVEGANYANAAIGKWHLSDRENGGLRSAVTSAFQEHVGFTRSYVNFEKRLNGKTVGIDTRYKTTAVVDEAIAWIDRQDEDRPWFLWVGFNNPHLPYHLPPRELHDFDDLEDRLYDRNNPDATHILTERAIVRVPEVRPYFAAMLQALDTEIGRLVEHIRAKRDGETYIVFVSDNGTQGEVAVSETKYYHFKHTVYEGGVRVPLIINGPRITAPGRTVDDLVNVSDLYATIVGLAGGEDVLQTLGVTLDSVSLLPYLEQERAPSLRSWIYTEKGSETGGFQHAVRDERFKLMIDREALRFFDLENDPLEERNLIVRTPSELQRDAARNLFNVFRGLYASEIDPFTDVEIDALEERYPWLACVSSNEGSACR